MPRVPQIAPAKEWSFTLNNPDTHGVSSELMSEWLRTHCSKWIFQLEEGVSGTPHFQGCCVFKEKTRPLSKESGPMKGKINWEKTRMQGASERYCQKEEGRLDGPWSHGVAIRIIRTITQLRAWQTFVYSMLTETPSDREIMWFWEPQGGVGKSAFVKYLCVKMGAITVSGKGADVKYAVASYVEKHKDYPKIIIFDIPRSFNQEYLCYEALEKIKDGCFFSGKYESGMVLGNAPHLLVFSNEEPSYQKLSADRWSVLDLRTVPGTTT